MANVKQVKKLKQIIAEEGGTSESEEIEVEDSGDDVGDDSDDSEDDDEEEEEEEDSDHDGETDEEFPEKVVNSTNTKESTSKKQKPTNIAPERSQVTLKQAEQFKPSASNVLLFNMTRLNEVEMHGFLSKRGVNPESISCINSPVALLGFADEAAAKKAIKACSGAGYGQCSLAAVSVNGDDIAMIRSNKNPIPGKGDAPLTCVFVTLIPKAVAENEIRKVIGITPMHVRLITSGPKNVKSNACYIDCKSEDDAHKAFEALKNHKFNGVQVKVLLKPQFGFNPLTETSVIVSNVPFTAGIEDIKKEFPTAKKVECTKKGSFMLTFETAEEKNKVVKESEHKTMDGRELHFFTDKSSNDVSIFVSNVAFAVTADELKAVFPDCKRVFMKKGPDGRFNG